MRESDKHSSAHLAVAGMSSGFISAFFRLPAETITNRLRDYEYKIFGRDSLEQSFIHFRHAISPNQHYTGVIPIFTSVWSIGAAWGVFYRISQGAIQLPLQKKIKSDCLDAIGIEAQNKSSRIAVGTAAGIAASLIELAVIHPLDNMRVKTQARPQDFTLKTSFLYFWVHLLNLQLYSGLSMFVARNVIVQPVCWGAKESTERVLENSRFKSWQIPSAAFMYIALLNILEAPCDTVRFQLLKTKNTTAMTVITNIAKQQGIRGFYRAFGSSVVASFAGRLPQMWFFDAMTNSSNPSQPSEQISQNNGMATLRSC